MANYCHFRAHLHRLFAKARFWQRVASLVEFSRSKNSTAFTIQKCGSLSRHAVLQIALSSQVDLQSLPSDCSLPKQKSAEKIGLAKRAQPTHFSPESGTATENAFGVAHSWCGQTLLRRTAKR